MAQAEPTPTTLPRQTPWRWLAGVYGAWVDRQDMEAAGEAFTPRAVMLFLGVSNLSLLLCVKWPPLASALDVQLGPALWMQVPMLAFYAVMAAHRPLQRMNPQQAGLFMLVESTLVLAWLASLMAFSSFLGTLVFAVFFLNGAATYGYLLRTSVTAPFAALGALVAGLWAMVLEPDPTPQAFIGLATLSAVATSVLMGSASLRHARAVAQRAQLEAAVHAQMMNERTARLAQLQDLVQTQLGFNHDLNNLLAVVQSSLEYLEQQPSGGATAAEHQEAVMDALDATRRAAEILTHSRRSGKDAFQRQEQVVAVVPVLSSVVGTLRRRFPGVDIRLEPPAESLQILVHGGEETLHRVLTNLVVNACQGNGQHHAHTVTLRMSSRAAPGTVVLEVVDDGPGFPPEQLNLPVQGFGTTKKDGTGLGLYTCERLLWAGGGQLQRANGPGGGAVVRVTLLERV